MWAKHAEMMGHPSLLQAYNVALKILPEVAWLGLSISDRHHHILKAGKTVTDAAAAAISAGMLEKAVEWLEQGRSIIWGQLLNLRTPVDGLKESHPELAEKLIFLSKKLEGAGTRDSSLLNSRDQQLEPLQRTAKQYHDYAHARNLLLKEIRELDGFQKFLLPKTISELSHAAERGPVVILNIGEFRCDALVLMPGFSNDEVLHIPLSDLTLKDAQHLRQSMGSLLRDGGRNDRLTGQREGSVPPETQFTHILSELWVRIVKPVLEGIGYRASYSFLKLSFELMICRLRREMTHNAFGGVPPAL
jgi:hypothetical protein